MGFGDSNFGAFPFATGNLPAAQQQTTMAPATIPAASTRTLLPSGDYLRDATSGEYVGGDPIDQEAIFRLRTQTTSCVADVRLGVDALGLVVIGDGAEVQIRSEVETALRPMLERRAIVALTVVATVSSQQGSTKANYSVTYTKTGVRS